MTSKTTPLVPIFDGHNDALLRLHRRGGTDGALSFVNGVDKGHLDLPMAQKGGFLGGLFAIFVPSNEGPRPDRDAPPADGNVDIPLPPVMEAVDAQRTVVSMV